VSTSLVDIKAYRDFWALAARDSQVFVTFRQHPLYEHMVIVSPELGQQYLSALEVYPTLAESRTGDPRMHRYAGGRMFDPTMLRYYHQRQEIWRHFGQTDHMRVLEIGGGFGGLATLFEGHCTAYYMCDLPEARALQHAYGARALDAVPGGRYDLLVSAYAFSELNREIQIQYAKSYIVSRGWMVYNFINPQALGADEVLDLFPGSRWEAEAPLSHPDNRILVWGDR
jgi:hypothetical protein